MLPWGEAYLEYILVMARPHPESAVLTLGARESPVL